jgi:hypothetical protein
MRRLVDFPVLHCPSLLQLRYHWDKHRHIIYGEDPENEAVIMVHCMSRDVYKFAVTLSSHQ